MKLKRNKTFSVVDRDEVTRLAVQEHELAKAHSLNAARVVVGSIMNEAIAAAIETARNSVATSGWVPPTSTAAARRDAVKQASVQRVQRRAFPSSLGSSGGRTRDMN